jgi:hypothetical protein
VDLSREYRGFVWVQGFRQNLAQMGTLFAVLLGTGGVVSGVAFSIVAHGAQVVVTSAGDGQGRLCLRVSTLSEVPLGDVCIDYRSLAKTGGVAVPRHVKR